MTQSHVSTGRGLNNNNQKNTTSQLTIIIVIGGVCPGLTFWESVSRRQKMGKGGNKGQKEKRECLGQSKFSNPATPMIIKISSSSSSSSIIIIIAHLY